jgi:succinyl-diaminopimelate desuccinylase
MTKRELHQKVNAFIKANESAIVRDLGRIIAKKSVNDPTTAAPGAPFGKGPRAALDETLAMAKDLGLATFDCDGYMGWAKVPGQSEGHLATIAHVDVVPEGEGWSTDPYKLHVKDGYLLGRGVMDDKGPMILSLYMAKFFAEQEELPRYGIRALVGCNEETGMTDIEYYLERQPMPLFCFTPDANFPVCYGEKGHRNMVFVSDVLGGNIVEFSGGIANNVVPDRATCLVKGDAAGLANTDGVSVETENSMVRLTAKGIGGHASMPEGTVNAIGLLVDYLLDHSLCTEAENSYLKLLKLLHHGTDGSGVGVACKDDLFDALTIIGGMVEMKDGRLRQYMDCRFPTAITGEKLRAALAAEAEKVGATLEADPSAEPFVTPKDSAPIQTLLGVYNEISGKNEQPFTMGGGTYARHFKSAASFGPEEPDEVIPDFVGTIHGANEGMSLKSILRALKIYILAMYELQQLDY